MKIKGGIENIKRGIKNKQKASRGMTFFVIFAYLSDRSSYDVGFGHKLTTISTL